ncbi:MAG: DUF4328 domain-containing protein [Verrucomicrobiales bacterium]|jgi:hypothetical protein|nr:DUF4328 domain-containing protein [Verrucomicrobiales bacterium]
MKKEKIHISSGNGQSSQYDEGQVRSMLQQGRLRDDALFWKIGMADWQPLRNLFPQPSKVEGGPPPIPHGLTTASYTFTKNPLGLTQALKVMLWIYLGVTVISLLSDFAQMSLVSSGSVSLEAAESNDARQRIIGWLGLGVYIVTGVIFLKWKYRANLNCRGFGATDMRFTPGWSIGWYFIPFLNFVRPYQVMKEIWKVSSNPSNWQTQKGSPILGWWWTLWLVSCFLGRIVFHMSKNVNSPSSLEAATMASIISSMVTISLTIVAVTLVSRIIEKQTKLTQSSG